MSGPSCHHHPPEIAGACEECAREREAHMELLARIRTGERVVRVDSPGYEFNGRVYLPRPLVETKR